MSLKFIVIGAQKSASTFLQNSLQAHPDIYMPDGETPYFEDPDYGLESRDFLSEIFQGRQEPLLGIKRPNYIGKAEVPARIQADYPDARLIAVLRNPVERAVAAYFHQIKYGTLPPISLEEGLSLLLDENKALLNKYPRGKEVLEFGLYCKYLKKYSHFFERNSILVMLHDDFLKSPEQMISTTYKFLGVDSSYKVPNVKARPQKVIYSIPRLRFLTLRNRFLHSYNKDRTRLKARKMSAPEYVLVAFITAIDRYFLSSVFSAGRPNISTELRRRLYRYYEEDINDLGLLINNSLSGWKY